MHGMVSSPSPNPASWCARCLVLAPVLRAEGLRSDSSFKVPKLPQVPHPSTTSRTSFSPYPRPRQSHVLVSAWGRGGHGISEALL
ncbi:hypothetical protein LZ30DRAFT_717783 [Colletotrichum cereale]|nr:hypothetical protein LZ30DRAFT_717783 [Colletotrichum cereale]